MPLDSTLLAKNGFCLVSDLDWTMVDHKDVDHEKLLRFNRQWLTHFDQGSLLVFSTGRSPQLFNELALDVPLLTPDILVCSVGTEILIRGHTDTEWEAHLEEGWDRSQVAIVAGRFPELVLQQGSEQRPHKVSYKLYAADSLQAQGVISSLRAQLASAGLDTNVVFSGGDDVDILPSRASKGKALSFLLSQIMLQSGSLPEVVMVCGDSGNDVELFEVPGVYGCVVGNAHTELRQWCEANGHDRIFEATEDGPGGIIQALGHFGFDARIAAMADSKEEAARRSAVVVLHLWFEDYFNAGADEDDEPHAASDRIEAMDILEASLGEGFELVGPQGTVTSRAELLKWFRAKGKGSRASRAPSTGTGQNHQQQQQQPEGLLAAAVARDSPSGDIESSLSAAFLPEERPSSSLGSGKFRIWIDNYSERELVPGTGIWLVRYRELQQRFPPAAAMAGSSGVGRSARWSSAVLQKGPGNTGYQWLYVHETWIEPPAASDPPPVLA